MIATYKELTPKKLAEYSDCYWGLEGEERYSCDNIDDAIEYILDDRPEAELATEVEVVAMRPVAITAKHVQPESILDTTLEWLDEEYGDPDDRSEPTEAMLVAAAAFAEVIAKEYTVWKCDEVLRVILEDPLEWIEQHRPDWGNWHKKAP